MERISECEMQVILHQYLKILMAKLFFISSISIFLLFFLSACNSSYRMVEKEGTTQYYNVAYGHHKKHKMDVFTPSSVDSAKPIVLLIHGGSWKKGDKVMLRPVQKMLLKNGFSTVNINYRLINKKIGLSEQLQDIGSSVVKSDSILNLSTNHPYILLGESAGGQLAMLYGYHHNEKVNKIISLSGPTNLADKAYTKSVKSIFAIPVLNKLTKSNFKRRGIIPLAYKEASPYVNVTNIPTLLIHGVNDWYVNKRQAYLMDSVLLKKGVPHRLVMIKWGGHISRLNPFLRNKFVYPAIKEWVNNKN